MLEFPRWEDWAFGYEEGGALGWLGNGLTRADRERGDTASYLDDVDHPSVPLSWRGLMARRFSVSLHATSASALV